MIKVLKRIAQRGLLMVEKSEYYISSTNGNNKLHVIMWQPVAGTKAILQIAHGMSEYIDRYDRFATFMASQGILVIGNDHLGHGESVADADELGYFPTKELSKTVVKDLYKVTKNIRARYPYIPFFLLGHSMGSFLARRYMMTYGNQLDGIIIMGTGYQPPKVLKAAQTLAKTIGMAKGEKYRSGMMQKLAFGSYNKRIRPERTPYDWLSVNTENVDKYMEDPLCGFPFTINGYKTLFDVISFIQDDANIRKVPKDLPMLFVSGEEDPVGDYGSGVRAAARSYISAGAEHVELKLYPGDRHEILNERDYETVQEDILKFVRTVIKEKKSRT